MAGVNNNLMPPPKHGEVRNPKGKPKGILNISTRVRQILDSEFDWTLFDKEKSKELRDKYGSIPVARALIYAQINKALEGDTAAFRALVETGWGKIINVSANATVEVMHIYKPEKLEVAQLEHMAQQLRERSDKIVEAEILDKEVA